jgi:spore germination protein KB
MIILQCYCRILTNKKNLKGLFRWITLCCVNIVIISLINIGALGPDLLSRSPYPLVNTIWKVKFGFLERLDIFIVIYLIFGGFFKITLYYYVAVIGTADLFKFKNSYILSFPLGAIILFGSIFVASNITEQIYEGQKVLPFICHWFFQIILPVILLIITVLKHAKN